MFTFEVIVKLLWLALFPLGGCAIAGVVALLVGADEEDDVENEK